MRTNAVVLLTAVILTPFVLAICAAFKPIVGPIVLLLPAALIYCTIRDINTEEDDYEM